MSNLRPRRETGPVVGNADKEVPGPARSSALDESVQAIKRWERESHLIGPFEGGAGQRLDCLHRWQRSVFLLEELPEPGTSTVSNPADGRAEASSAAAR
jgi:hypothetical protein